MDERRLDIKVSMDDAELSSSIAKTKKEISSFQSELRATDAQIKTYGKTTETLGKRKEVLTKKLDAQEKQMELLEEAYARQTKSGNENSDQAIKLKKEMNNLSGQMAKTQGDIDKVSDEMEYFDKSVDDTGKSLNDLYQDLTQANSGLKQAEAELKLANSEIKAFGENAQTSGNKIEALNNVYSAQESRLEALTRAYDRQAKKTGESSREAQQLQVEITNLKSDMNKTASEIDSFNKEVDEIDDVAEVASDGIDDLGDSLSNLSLDQAAENLGGLRDKIMDVGAAAIESAAEVDMLGDRFAKRIQGTEEDAARAKEIMDNLYEGMSVDSYEEAYEVISQVQQQLTGLNDEQLEGASQAAANLAKVYDMDVSETLRGVDAIMTTFGVSADEAFDLMAEGAANGLNYSDELGDNVAEYATYFKEGGYSAEEMFAILEAGADAGAYNLDKVNDLVKEFGIRMTDGTIAKAAEELGGNFQTIATDFENGAITSQEAFQLMVNEIMAMEDETQQQIALQEIFGSTGEDNSLQVLKGMTELNGTLGETSENYKDVAGAAALLGELEGAEKMEASIRMIKNALIPLGDYLIELANVILPIIVEALGRFSNWWENANPLIKNVIKGIGAFVVALAVIVPLIASVLATVGLVSVGLAGLGYTIGGIALGFIQFVGVVGLVIAAFAVLKTIFENNKEAFSNFTDALKNGISNIVDSAKKIYENIKPALENLLTGIIEFATELGLKIKEVFTIAFGFILQAIEAIIGPILEMWETHGELIVSTISGFLNMVISTITSWISTFWSFISPFLDSIITFIQPILDSLLVIISTVVQTIVNIVVAIMQVFNGDWQSAWNLIKETAVMIWNNLWTVVQTVLGAAITFIADIITILVTNIATWFTTMYDNIVAIWTAIQPAIMGVLGPMVSAVSEKITQFVDAIKNSFETFKSKVTEIWNNITEKIKSSVSAITSSFSGIQTAIENVKGYFNGLWNTVSSVFTNIGNKISDTWSNVKSKMNDLAFWKSEGDVNVSYDENPYDPLAATMDGFTEAPVNNLGGRIKGSVNSSFAAITSGINSALNNLDSLYAKDIPDSDQTRSNNHRIGSSSTSGRDATLELLADMLDMMTKISEKEDYVILDGEVIARKIHKPLKRYSNIQDTRSSKLRGETNY